ncbi:hypothetical protein GYMLUDRAFT_35684 [Collybiopsis luxurians FD-317 M1]|nr:hypothetical protein GYMLUDRAFT_35684 [Collybiopsis luxurians FD-317 M1]
MSSNKTNDRLQKILLELATQPGNDVCADCKSRVPRWASHNLGIFICVNCASIHRKIGTHITKVKSLTMDSWTKEQVERMKEMGNLNSNAIYNPNELRHPPPPMLTEDERDSELEKYIRAKYEYKRFFDKHALVASKLGPSRSSSILPPRTSSNPTSPASSRPPAIPSSSSSPNSASITQTRSVSQPVLSSLPSAASQPAIQPQPKTQTPLPPSSSPSNQKGGVWNDLLALQSPSANSSLPLQYQQFQTSAGLGSSTNPFSNMTGMNSAGFAPTSTGLPSMIGTGMGTGPNGLTINLGPTPTMGMGLGAGYNSPMSFSAGMAPNPTGTNPFQQQFLPNNPFAQQQPASAGFPASASMLPSAGSAINGLPAGLSTPFMAQQQSPAPSFYPSQASPMIPQSQMQLQSPAPMFSPVPQNPSQLGYGGGMQMQGGHSPQPQMSTTPQLTMSTTPQFVSSPSPHLQMSAGTMGMGMRMNGMNGGQQQMQMPMQQPQMGPGSAGLWGQQQQQPAMFGQQWGGM